MEKPQSRIETSKQLYAVFIANTKNLLSDGTVEQNGLVRVSTRRGATLTSERVIEAARRIAEKKANDARIKSAKSADRERRKIWRAIEDARKSEAADRREEQALQKLKHRRERIRAQAQESRLARRRLRRDATLLKRALPDL